MAEPLGAAIKTSGLNKVRNDTGRTAFCGPYILSALTGFPVSRVELEVNPGPAPRRCIHLLELPVLPPSHTHNQDCQEKNVTASRHGISLALNHDLADRGR